MNGVKVLSVFACLLAWLTTPSQAQPSSPPVLGFLSTAAPSARNTDQVIAFLRGLSEAGFTENQNVKIEYRWASNDYAKLPSLATELIQSNARVIVAAGGHVTALAAHNATKTIPIVFTTVTDPVKDGLVASLNRPGGNATGTAGLTSELDAKRLELIREIMPKAAVIGVLVNKNRPGVEIQLRDVRAAAEKLGLELDIHKPVTIEEIADAFKAMASRRVDAVVVAADPFFNNNRSRVIALAAEFSMPAIYQWREFVSAGGLMSYGPSITEAYQHAGKVAGQILNGAKPADIPVVQPATFVLAINQKTARKLGLEVPQSLLLRASEVIE